MKIYSLLLILGIIFCSCSSVEEAPIPDWEFLFQQFIDEQPLKHSSGLYFLKTNLLCEAIDCNKKHETKKGDPVFIYSREDLFMRKIYPFIEIKDLNLLRTKEQ